METKKYLPLLTSRGCPYPCKFCVIPATNGQRWRKRTPENVLAEMKHYYETLGVREFHIEDVDPTINDKRTKELSQLIINSGIPFIWKICSGTKVETIRSEETLDLMARAGCNYISISPETGSKKVLKTIGKPFNLEHAVKIVKKMHQVGIKSQACFVIGFPGEEDEDRLLTRELVKDLTKVGLDEIALFIITPIPGSAIFGEFSGYKRLSQLNFSPTWRNDYPQLNRFRLDLYRSFLIWKLRYQFFKMAQQPFHFLLRNFKTKMEMTPYRALHTYFLIRKLVRNRKSQSKPTEVAMEQIN